MAIFGDVGKFLGLGSTKDVASSAARAALLTAVGVPPTAAIGSQVPSAMAQPRAQQGQSTAVSVAPQPPMESAFSGELGPTYRAGISPASYRAVPQAPRGRSMVQPAAAGALVPFAGGAVTSGARALLPYIFGGAVGAAPIIMDSMGQEKKLRVTRKLKTQVRNAVQVFGPEAVAEQLGTDVNVVFYILTKKMRNDGPYVTKAAVRKTRQTVRKMKHLCDMYDDLRPAAKRRAPARRSSATTLIKN